MAPSWFIMCCTRHFVWEWNLSVLKAFNSVFHLSRCLKGQPFSVSAIINLALWLHRQARHQDYDSISITHPKAPNYLLHKAETTLLSSALQSHGIKEKIAKVFWKEAKSLQWLCTTVMNLQLPPFRFMHHPGEQIQIFPLKSRSLQTMQLYTWKQTMLTSKAIRTTSSLVVIQYVFVRLFSSVFVFSPKIHIMFITLLFYSILFMLAWKSFVLSHTSFWH